jgi:hypothetical protein
MKWNNRSYRPGNYAITQQKKVVDISELLKPYDGSNKGGVWIPVQQVVANVPQPSSGAPDVTPTPTSSLTPTPTTTLTSTPTPTSSDTPTPTPTTTLTSTPTPTSSDTPTPTSTGTATPTPTPTVVYTTEYQAVLNFATSQSYPIPSDSQRLLQNQIIVDLKASGIWDSLDLFYVFANDGSQSFATLNWKNPGSTYQIGFVNSPIYITNKGLQGNDVSAYCTTGWKPTNGVQYTDVNASRFAWVFTGTSNNSKAIDIVENGVDYTCYANAPDQRVNSNNNLNSAFDFTGNNMLKFISRRPSNTMYLRNGNTTGTRTQTFTGLQNSNLNLFGRPLGNNSNVGISIYGVGAPLVDLDDELNTILSTYISSI